MEKDEYVDRAYIELEVDRNKTRENMSRDICSMSEALSRLKNLSIEGNILREDLLGLLEFESNCLHQIDSLMIERRKIESKDNRFRFENKIVQAIQ